MRGYLHTWAIYGLQIADAAAFDDKTNLPADQYPGLKRFYSQQPARHSPYVSKFYELVKETTEARRTMRQMAKSYRPEIADELEQTPENSR